MDSPGLDLQQIWCALPPPDDLDDALLALSLEQVYGRGAAALDNLTAAVPDFPDAPMSTVEIWRAAARPKPKYTEAVRFLKQWAAADDQLEHIGGSRGPQFYRWIPDAIATAIWNTTEATRQAEAFRTASAAAQDEGSGQDDAAPPVIDVVCEVDVVVVASGLAVAR